MRLFLIILLSLFIFPVFAQEEVGVAIGNGTNNTSSNEHSEIMDNINQLAEDNSHSEIIDNINQFVEKYSHSDMMVLIQQFNNINSLNSYTGLVLGAIAILITIRFGFIARTQNRITNDMILGTRDLTTEIKKDTEELSKIRKEVKEDVSFALKKRIHFVKRNLERCIKLYKDYQSEKDPGRKENFLNSAFARFDQCYTTLRIDLDLIKLIEIFGRPVGRQYWNLLSDFQLNSKNYFTSDDEGEIHSFMSHVDDCLKRTLNFEKIIEPFASASVKS